MACRITSQLLKTSLTAAALVLLFAPSASGQPFDQRTEGRIDTEGLSVGVFADIADAQTEKMRRAMYEPTGDIVSLPVEPPPASATLGNTPGSLTAGDLAFLHDPRVAPRPTLFDGALYASNSPDAYNTLLISAAAAGVTATEEGCAIAEVSTGGEVITVQMAATSDRHYQAFVRILDPRSGQGHVSSDGPSCGDYAAGVGGARLATVLARHRGDVSIRVAGAGTVSVEVDGEGPEFFEVTPEDRREAHKGRITFEVHDIDSGLRHDGELVITPDGDYKPVNADGDNVTYQEPLTIANEGAVRLNGKAADIDLQVAQGGQDPRDAPDITDSGDWEMLGERPGVTYYFSADVDFLSAGRHQLGLRAVDRVGNVSATGSIHDVTPPSVVEAWTGIAFDHERNREVASRSWIMLDFGEPVSDAGFVAGRIGVSWNRVVDVVHSHAPEGAFETVTQLIGTAGVSQEHEVDPRSRLYVRLAWPLQPDETPEIVLRAGALQDVAGNANEQQVITSRDGIGPGFTVRVVAVEEGVDPDFTTHSISGSSSGRPVVNGEQSFVVDVMADEELAGRPALYFTGIRAQEIENPAIPGQQPPFTPGRPLGPGGVFFPGAGPGRPGQQFYDYTIGEGLRAGASLARHDEEQHWRRTYTASELGSFDGLFGLVIVGEDEHGNTGATPGWTPTNHQQGAPPALGNALDLYAMDDARLLLEVDRQFNGGVRPREHVTFRRHDDDESEVDLFVRLDFSEEGLEYEKGEFSDSHGTVTITEITLDGEDAMPLLTRLNSGAFELLAHNPGESHHDVEYTAMDDAGNHEHFDVHVHPLGAEEPPYEVQLSPGWNLISLPGTPEQPALGDVVPSRGLVTPVLSYQDGDWRTAILDDGVWRGRLEQIVGGYGYWMFSIAAETIAVDIPDQERREKLPSVPVTHGWNLLGVIDLFRNEQGEPPGPEDGGGGEADHYFATIPWRMAYTFDTPRNRWVRLIPRDDDAGTPDDTEPPEIVNGRGYWVWSEEPSTLVP
ncbi:MAG: hypothetical protein OXE50_12160 [Chloroflexi bacterium]|nr:hypothetical protein [Chloroflexota bacterium]